MAYKSLNQKGVSHLILLLIVLVIAIVGFAGYRVMEANETKETTKTPATSDEIKSSADLEREANELENEKVDENLDPSQLDEDVSEL